MHIEHAYGDSGEENTLPFNRKKPEEASFPGGFLFISSMHFNLWKTLTLKEKKRFLPTSSLQCTYCSSLNWWSSHDMLNSLNIWPVRQPIMQTAINSHQHSPLSKHISNIIYCTFKDQHKVAQYLYQSCYIKTKIDKWKKSLQNAHTVIDHWFWL